MNVKSKTIILGSIIAVTVLMLVPSISAIETSQVVESHKSQLFNRFQEMDISSLIQNIKENAESYKRLPGSIIELIISLILNVILIVAEILLVIWIILFLWP